MAGFEYKDPYEGLTFNLAPPSPSGGAGDSRVAPVIYPAASAYPAPAGSLVGDIAYRPPPTAHAPVPPPRSMKPIDGDPAEGARRTATTWAAAAVYEAPPRPEEKNKTELQTLQDLTGETSSDLEGLRNQLRNDMTVEQFNAIVTEGNTYKIQATLRAMGIRDTRNGRNVEIAFDGIRGPQTNFGIDQARTQLAAPAAPADTADTADTAAAPATQITDRTTRAELERFFDGVLERRWPDSVKRINNQIIVPANVLSLYERYKRYKDDPSENNRLDYETSLSIQEELGDFSEIITYIKKHPFASSAPAAAAPAPAAAAPAPAAAATATAATATAATAYTAAPPAPAAPAAETPPSPSAARSAIGGVSISPVLRHMAKTITASGESEFGVNSNVPLAEVRAVATPDGIEITVGKAGTDVFARVSFDLDQVAAAKGDPAALFLDDPNLAALASVLEQSGEPGLTAIVHAVGLGDNNPAFIAAVERVYPDVREQAPYLRAMQAAPAQPTMSERLADTLDATVAGNLDTVAKAGAGAVAVAGAAVAVRAMRGRARLEPAPDAAPDTVRIRTQGTGYFLEEGADTRRPVDFEVETPEIDTTTSGPDGEGTIVPQSPQPEGADTDAMGIYTDGAGDFKEDWGAGPRPVNLEVTDPAELESLAIEASSTPSAPTAPAEDAATRIKNAEIEITVLPDTDGSGTRAALEAMDGNPVDIGDLDAERARAVEAVRDTVTKVAADREIPSAPEVTSSDATALDHTPPEAKLGGVDEIRGEDHNTPRIEGGPDSVESPNTPALHGERRDVGGGKKPGKGYGGKLGLAITAATTALTVAIFAAAPDNLEELRALSPEAADAAARGDYETAGAYLARDARNSNYAKGVFAEAFKGLERASPQMIDGVMKAVSANAAGDSAKSEQFLYQAGLPGDFSQSMLEGRYGDATLYFGGNIVGDEALAAWERGDELAAAGYTTKNVLSMLDVDIDNIVAAWDAEDTTAKAVGESVVATMGEAFDVATLPVVAAHAAAVWGLEFAGVDVPEFMPEWQKSPEGLRFDATIKALQSYSINGIPDDAPPAIREMVGLYENVMAAEADRERIYMMPFILGQHDPMVAKPAADKVVENAFAKFAVVYDDLETSGELENTIIPYFNGEPMQAAPEPATPEPLLEEPAVAQGSSPKSSTRAFTAAVTGENHNGMAAEDSGPAQPREEFAAAADATTLGFKVSLSPASVVGIIPSVHASDVAAFERAIVEKPEAVKAAIYEALKAKGLSPEKLTEYVMKSEGYYESQPAFDVAGQTYQFELKALQQAADRIREETPGPAMVQASVVKTSASATV